MTQTISVEILKKNRKFFAAILNGKYKCKIIIDKNSEDLNLGKQDLLVNDRSVRSKYGNDLIFELTASANEQKVAGICTLTHRYNSELVDKCRELGGRFDYETKAWVFSDIVEKEVEELDYIYNSNEITVEITSLDELSEWHAPVCFLGYTIARATGRDSGAKLGDGVYKIEGHVTSGGSVKNWSTVVEEDTKLRLKVPENLLNVERENEAKYWAIEIVTDKENKNTNEKNTNN